MQSETRYFEGERLPAGITLTGAGTIRLRWWVAGKTYSKTLKLPHTRDGVDEAARTRANYVRHAQHDIRVGKRFSVGSGYAEIFRAARKRGGKKYHLSREDEKALVDRASGYCELTGIPFQFRRNGKNERRPFMASLDRIDSKAGYIVGNVRLVCVAANLAMNQWGEEVLIEVAEGLINTRNRRESTQNRRGENKN